MPPYDNRMSQMGPTGQMQMPQMDPAMISQLMQRYAAMQGQQAPFAQQGGMQNMTPDQGVNQAPGMPPGVAETMRGMGMGQPGGMPMPKPNLGPGSPPFMPPGMDQMMQKPMVRPPWMGGGAPSAPPQQVRPSGPPPMRLPPGAGVYKNPATGQMMNQTPSFSGQVNPATMDKPAAPQTGGVMTMPPASDSPVDPIRVPTSVDKPGKPIQGSPPFNPNPNNRIRQTTGVPPTEPGMVNQGGLWADQQKKKAGLARAMTSRVTAPSVR